MASEKTAIILKYDIWDADDTGEIVRFPAAPVEGVDAENQPVRTATTMVRREFAQALVKSGKATVPFR